MRIFRLVTRLIGLTLVQLWGVVMGLAIVIVLLPFPKARYTTIARAMNLWGRMCCWVMNVRIQREGSMKPTGRGALIVANHIGTMDIFVTAACFEMAFVSKSDIRSWPFIGQLTQLAGTIYIDRARRTQVLGMVRDMTDRLRAGHSVAVYPEGRATLGDKIEYFNSSAFEAVVQANGSVIPVMIRYYDDREPSVACWQLYVPFWKNMMQILMTPRLDVLVCALPEVTGEPNRRAFAEKSRQMIAEKFRATAKAPVKMP